MKGCLAIVLLAVLLPTGCANNAQSTNEKGNQNERTVKHEKRAILTGVITDVWNSERTTNGQLTQHEWISVEEDPDANCGNDPVTPGCEKIDFKLDDARVYREEGISRQPASVKDLEAGQRVSADYTGYLLLESYPSQTDARKVIILRAN